MSSRFKTYWSYPFLINNKRNVLHIESLKNNFIVISSRLYGFYNLTYIRNYTFITNLSNFWFLIPLNIYTFAYLNSLPCTYNIFLLFYLTWTFTREIRYGTHTTTTRTSRTFIKSWIFYLNFSCFVIHFY